MSTTEKRRLVVKSHPGLSLAQRCKFLGTARSGMYYKSPLKLALMKAIDKQYLEHP